MRMKERLGRLRRKEVVGVSNGIRYGFVGDVEMELDSGRVSALIVPGRPRLFGLLGREEDLYIPWDGVCRFGEDLILVERIPDPEDKREAGRKRKTHWEK